MTIFCAAADHHSFAALLGRGPTNVNGNLSNCDNATTHLSHNFGKQFKCSGLSGNSIFVQFFILNGFFWNGTDEWLDASAFSIYNSDGVKISSVGWKRQPGVVGGDSMANCLGVSCWDAAGTWVKHSPSGATALPITGRNDNRTLSKMLAMHFEFNPTDPTKHRVRVWWDGKLLITVTGTDVTTATNVETGEFRFGKLYEGDGNPRDYFQCGVSSLVVSDYEDHTLIAHPYKAQTIGVDNQFTGAIGALQTWLQDKTYLSSSSELGDRCTFKMGPCVGGSIWTPKADLYTGIAGTGTAVNIDFYGMGRYIQSGGTSVTLILSFLIGGLDAITPFEYVVTANQDDNYYQVTKLLSVRTNILTGKPFTIAELASGTVQFKLKDS